LSYDGICVLGEFRFHPPVGPDIFNEQAYLCSQGPALTQNLKIYLQGPALNQNLKISLQGPALNQNLKISLKEHH